MASPLDRLVDHLAKLPGIGRKTATRLAFHILKMPQEDAQALARSIDDMRAQLKLCSVCCYLTDHDPCSFCRDARRDPALICIVAQPQDVVAFERAGAFRGRYHVLHGVLSPLDGIGPDDLKISALARRLDEAKRANQPVQEIIIATSPNVEGDATAVYLARLLQPLVPRISRIASGVPIGGEVEYADGVTLGRALSARRDM